MKTICPILKKKMSKRFTMTLYQRKYTNGK